MATAAATSRAAAEADHTPESGADRAAAAAKRLSAPVKGKAGATHLGHHRGKHEHHRRSYGHLHDPTRPLPDPQRSALLARTGIQPALLISQPGDAAEAEADRVADRVVAMKESPAVPIRASGDLQRSPLVVQRAAARAPAPPAPQPIAENVADAATEAAVKAELSGGAPMAADVAGFFGRRFGANFGDVRIHTDDKAANLSTRLGARAFTYGRHVFFNAGQYNPDSEEGTKLIAHELAHTIQQSAVIQLKEDSAAPPRVTSRSAPQAQRGIVSRALNWIADKANYIPGFRLFTIIIGVNPINMASVERSGANILRALIEFIPGGGLIVDALNNHGIFEKGGKFIEDQFASLGMVGGAFRDALMEFIDSLSWSDVFHLGDVWDRAKRIFTAPVDKLISFGKGLVTGIANIVKDAILKPLGRYAASIIPKFDLLAGVFGKNPVSGESASPAGAIIGGFMTLIGQEEIWANIQKSGAVGKAWSWFKGAMSGALDLVKSIPDRFVATIKSLTIFDIVTIVGAWAKFAMLFLGFVKDFMGWALKQVLKLLEIILEVVAPSVIPYLKKAGAAFNTIIKAPGRFIGFLVQAGKAGFNMFKTNILGHLQRGILDWLLGSLAGANLYIPSSFAPRELLKFGLSVIGLTWANVRAKLVAATSETTVKVLETTFDIVKILVTEGPAAAWEELLKTLSNLKSMVMDAIINFVKGKVIEIAIEKVLSFLNPAGAFIQALLAIYRTISFVVTKLQQIGALVAALIDGIAAIAAGNIGPASAKVESVLAKGLSLAISFLANFAGLGNVSKKVIEIIDKIRKPVDVALDKLVTWIVDKAKAVGKMVVDKVTGKANRTDVDIKRDIDRAKAELPGKIDGLLAKDPSKLRVRAQLAIWKLQYKLTDLKLTEAGEDGKFVATVNPTFDVGGKVLISISKSELLALVSKVSESTLKGSSILARERTRQRKEEQTHSDPTADPTITSQGARSTLAFATRLRQNKPGNTPSNPTFVMGQDAQGKDVTINWPRPYSVDWNRLITSPQGTRRYLGPGGLAQSLPKGQKAIDAVETMSQGGQLPKDMNDPHAAGELSALLFGQEVARNPENVALNAMALDEMKDKKLTTTQMIKSLPAGPEGASATQRQLAAAAKEGKDLDQLAQDAKDKGEKTAQKQDAIAAAAKGKSKAQREAAEQKAEDARAKGGTPAEVLKRTIDLITAWIETLLKTEGPVTKSKKGFTNWLEKKIRERVNKVIKDGN